MLNFHDVSKWKQFPRYWPFVWGIHRSPVNSPHKGQWRGTLMFSFICIWINGWVNNRKAGVLRHYRAHYDVIVMKYSSHNPYCAEFCGENMKIIFVFHIISRQGNATGSWDWPSSPRLFRLHGLTLIQASIISVMKCGMKLLIHFQTSTVQLLKFGNGWIISSDI